MNEPCRDARGDDDAVDLLPYVAAILRRAWWIAGTSLLAGALTAGYSLRLPNIYEATAKILPPQQDQGLVGALMGQMGGGMGGMAASLFGKGTSADLYAGMLTSDDIKEPLVERFQLMAAYRKTRRSDAYDALGSRSAIAAGAKDGIISIAVEDEDPKRAAALANAYVEEFEKLLIRLSSSGAEENRTFLAERLAAAKADLARAEDALKAFQAKNQTFDVPEQARASVTGLAALKAELVSQEVQLATLRRSFTESSPEVKNVLAGIGSLREQIARQEGRGAGALPSLGSVPQLGQTYVRLMREFKVQEALVELLTKQHEAAKFTEARNVATVQLIQRARVPDRKSKPHRARLVAANTAAVFLLGVFWVGFRTHLGQMAPERRARWRELGALLPLVGRFFRP